MINQLKVGIFGYGSQGRAQALNLRDSGVDVICTLPKNSKSRIKAREDSIEVVTASELVATSDIIVLLVPDELLAKVYNEEIKDSLREGQTLVFAHGYAICFEEIIVSDAVDLVLIAFKAPGPVLRDNYLKNINTPSFYSIKNSCNSKIRQIVEEYSQCCGSKSPLRFETTFKEETIANLYSEQTLVCAGITALMKTSFDVLVEKGVSREIAYFECLYKMKMMISMIHNKGFSNMYANISNTAEFGDYYVRDKIYKGDLKEEMGSIFDKIKDGTFHRDWLKEREEGFPLMNKIREEDKNHISEKLFKEFGKKIKGE